MTIEISIREGYDGAYGSITATFDAPPLAGSPAQIAWAEDIRRKAVASALRKLVESPGRAAATKEHPAKVEAYKAQIADMLSKATAAKLWIDTRGDVRAIGQRVGMV